MIDQKIRATVLESRTISGQICSFIEGQRRPVSPEEIGAAFPDIFPRWRLRQRLSEMVQQGRIGITDNGSYIFIRPAKGVGLTSRGVQRGFSGNLLWGSAKPQGFLFPTVKVGFAPTLKMDRSEKSSSGKEVVSRSTRWPLPKRFARRFRA